MGMPVSLPGRGMALWGDFRELGTVGWGVGGEFDFKIKRRAHYVKKDLRVVQG